MAVRNTRQKMRVNLDLGTRILRLALSPDTHVAKVEGVATWLRPAADVMTGKRAPN
jgi:hypothetical protein